MFMRRRAASAIALTAAFALALSACAADDEPDTPPAEDPDAPAEPDEPEDEPEAVDEPADVQVIYAHEQEFASYNNNTADQNAFRNTVVLNGVLGGFWQYGPDGFVQPDENFGTYELVSEDPQTVVYSFHPDAVWSDGEPIDCADFLLFWAANSGYYQHPTATDEDGNPLSLFSTAGTTGVEDWVKPDCAPGDKTITVEYANIYATWEAIGGESSFLPAHIVAEQGGLSSDGFVEAIRNDDVEAILDAADFYNTGWTMNPGELLAEGLIPSSGPYKLTNWVAGESVTMEWNENYWGPPPASRTVIFRFIDQDQMAQALDNREVDIIDPQPNPDLINQLQALPGIVMETGESFIYEHLDFNLRPGSPWLDRDLREAFALCVPRQLIVDNLIKPQNPVAEVANARNTYTFMPDYDVQIAGTTYERYTEVDIEASRQILEDLGMVGTDVRIGYFSPNPRRTNQVELIRDSCNEAGFNIIDAGSDTFFGVELDQGNYDIALFAWVGSAYVSGTASTFMAPEACAPGQTGNNFGCYSNPEVDALYRELLAELDPDAQRPLVAEIERILWEDLPTIPIFTFPSLAAWADDVTGVVMNVTQGGITWNKHEWGRL